MRSMKVIGISLAAALVLVACGGEETGGGGGGGGDTGATSLSLVDNEFVPSSLTVDGGASVDVTNDGQAPHTVTVEGSDINQEVESGAATTVTFDLEPGDYVMYCEFHRDGGMEGTLTVQ